MALFSGSAIKQCQSVETKPSLERYIPRLTHNLPPASSPVQIPEQSLPQLPSLLLCRSNGKHRYHNYLIFLVHFCSNEVHVLVDTLTTPLDVWYGARVQPPEQAEPQGSRHPTDRLCLPRFGPPWLQQHVSKAMSPVRQTTHRAALPWLFRGWSDYPPPPAPANITPKFTSSVILLHGPSGDQPIRKYHTD